MRCTKPRNEDTSTLSASCSIAARFPSTGSIRAATRCSRPAMTPGKVRQLLYAYGGTMELAGLRLEISDRCHRRSAAKLQPSKADQVLPFGWDDNGTEDSAYDIMRLAIRHGARFEHASEWNLRWTVASNIRRCSSCSTNTARTRMCRFLGIAGDERRRWPDAEKHRQTIAFLVEERGAGVNWRNEEGLTPRRRGAPGTPAHRRVPAVKRRRCQPGRTRMGEAALPGRETRA